MTVICIKQCCEESVLLLPLQKSASIEDDNFALLMGYTVDQEITEYNITIGREYTVYGFLVYKNQVRFLIQDNDGLPFFCPDALFQIQQTEVFWDWEMTSFFVEDMPLYLVGYPAMERNYSTLIDLVVKKNEAVKRFLEYKDRCKKYSALLE